MELLIKITGKDLAILPEKCSNAFFGLVKTVAEEIDARTALPAPAPATPANARAKKEESAPEVKQEVETPAPITENSQSEAPAAKKKYALAELQAACKPLMDNGKLQDLVNVVKDLGAISLSALDPAKYGEFAEKIRAMGATI